MMAVTRYSDFPVNEKLPLLSSTPTPTGSAAFQFLTAVTGLFGSTYATATVDRKDIVPPAPDLFTVVTETVNKSIAPLRRFSWSLQTGYR